MEAGAGTPGVISGEEAANSAQGPGASAAATPAADHSTLKPYHFVIDECLTRKLAQVATQAGYAAQTVGDLDLLGAKDDDLMAVVTARGAVFVTRNAVDFRGAGERKPGGLHAANPGHAGLIVLNGGDDLGVVGQEEAFKIALSLLAQVPTLKDHALEVWREPTGAFRAVLYRIPDPQGVQTAAAAAAKIAADKKQARLEKAAAAKQVKGK